VDRSRARQRIARLAPRELGALTGLIILCVFLAIRQPEFLQLQNLMNVLRQVSMIAITAAGMTGVILTGGIDLSVGSVLSLSACGAALSIKRWEWASGPGILFGLGIGTLCGIANGGLVTHVPLPPFIATLGTMGIARGLTFVITGGQTVYQLPEAFRYLGTGMVGRIPFPVILMTFIFAGMHVLLTHTRLGRYIYAIGGNETAARLSGVAVNRGKMIVYMLTGLLAGLSGLIYAARLDAAAPEAGDGFELDVIAAVVIGGTSLSGGEGRVLGSLVGALIMGVVRNGLNLMVVSSNWQRVIIGAIIIIAVTIDVIQRRGWKIDLRF